jgi:NADH dehydrogenase
MSAPTDTTSIVILGGGYAGILCANRLRSSLDAHDASRVRVTLVNPTAEFHERIRLHEVAAGTIVSAAKPLSGMLHPDIDILIGSAVRIDSARQMVDVMTSDGPRCVGFDRLVYAVGSGPTTTTPGAAEFAFALASPDGAAAARVAIATGAPGQRIVVVGGGFTGVETASEVAERHPTARVTLLSAGPIVAQMRPAARKSIVRSLSWLGVAVQEYAGVRRVEAGRLILGEEHQPTETPAAEDPAAERTVPFDVCLWTASFAVPELARVSGLATDELGRLRVDEYLRSVDNPAIIGAGDAVRLPDSVGRHVRMGCAMALPLGGAAAGTILATLHGEQPKPVSVGFILQCISIGRADGYVQLVRADDTPRRMHLGGRVGAYIKEAICTMTVSAARKERTKPGAYWGPKGPKPIETRIENAPAMS